MIVDSEDQRQIILQALMSVPIQGTYQGICEAFPKLQSVVESVKTAKIQEITDVERSE